jgi:mannose/fructose/N-acetylgalactosamine-specific phosphotransferase system component IIB
VHIILRIDDRLIHGQVIAGWARPLGIEVIILASDRISADEWARNAYRLAVPEGICFCCVGIKKCITTIHEQNAMRIMVIVESVREAFDLLTEGFEIKEINIGGLSYKDGTREIAPYIYLSREDIEAVVHIYEMGVKVIGKQLPNSSAIDVVKTLTGVK